MSLSLGDLRTVHPWYRDALVTEMPGLVSVDGLSARGEGQSRSRSALFVWTMLSLG